MEITIMNYKMSNKKGQVVMNEVFKEEDGKWYFWNEVWSDKHGPYKSKFEATHECSKYFWSLLDATYPKRREAYYTIVAIKNNKVVDQQHSIAKSEFKAAIKLFRKNNPGAKISIEDKDGKIIHTYHPVNTTRRNG
jgi:hypothetical protein